MTTWRRPHPIVTFRDALGLSFELGQLHRHGHFAVVTGPDHEVLQITARLPGRADRDLVIDLPHQADGPGDPDAPVPPLHLMGGGLLVVTLTAGEPRFGEADLAAYERCRQITARRRLTLRDWIRTDGDCYLSAAYLADPASAWPDDPPGERTVELAAAASRSAPSWSQRSRWAAS